MCGQGKVLTRLFEVAARHPQAAAVIKGDLQRFESGSFDWKDFAALAHAPTPHHAISSPSASSSAGGVLQLVPPADLLPIKDKKSKKEKKEKKDKKDKGKRSKEPLEGNSFPAKKQRKAS